MPPRRGLTYERNLYIERTRSDRRRDRRALWECGHAPEGELCPRPRPRLHRLPRQQPSAHWLGGGLWHPRSPLVCRPGADHARHPRPAPPGGASMKQALNLLAGMIGLLALPFSIYGSYLLYQHIHATELMWFLWWMVTPMSLLCGVLSTIASKLIREEV